MSSLFAGSRRENKRDASFYEIFNAATSVYSITATPFGTMAFIKEHEDQLKDVGITSAHLFRDFLKDTGYNGSEIFTPAKDSEGRPIFLKDVHKRSKAEQAEFSPANLFGLKTEPIASTIDRVMNSGALNKYIAIFAGTNHTGKGGTHDQMKHLLQLYPDKCEVITFNENKATLHKVVNGRIVKSDAPFNTPAAAVEKMTDPKKIAVLLGSRMRGVQCTTDIRKITLEIVPVAKSTPFSAFLQRLGTRPLSRSFVHSFTRSFSRSLVRTSVQVERTSSAPLSRRSS